MDMIYQVKKNTEDIESIKNQNKEMKEELNQLKEEINRLKAQNKYAF